MLEMLKTLKDTPLPIVLVIGGLIFLLIPFIQKIQAKEVGVETTNQLGAGVIGVVLLIVGIGLQIIPSGTAASTLPTAIPPSIISATETPIVTAATLAIQSTTIVQPSIIPPTAFVQPTNIVVSPSTVSLVNRASLSSDVPLAPLVKDVVQNPSQVSQTQLENAVRQIQIETARLRIWNLESNSLDLPQENWWLVWCSMVTSKYNNGIPAGWYYLFEQQLPTFGQLYVISPTAESRHLDSCNSPKGWWGVVISLSNP